MYDFEISIDEYRKSYIYNVGNSKYDKIVSKVHNSRTLESAIQQSINNKHPLLAGDFKIISDAAMSFLSGPSTAIMGQLIAFEVWQRKCNRNFEFFNEYELATVVNSMIRSYR